MAVIDKIKEKLDQFVAAGGSIDDLKSGHPLYEYIKDAKAMVNGRRLSLEQKFEHCGYLRARKISASVEQDLISAIEEYKQAGGDFNIEDNKLPFIGKLRIYQKERRRKTGENLSIDQCLRELGADNVSRVYRRYYGIMQVKNYADSQGNVDLYRQDPKMFNYISKASKSLDMPDCLVVGLIGNQNLKRCYIDANYIAIVKEKLLEFLKDFNLARLSEKEPKLYHQLRYISKNMIALNNDSLTKNDILELMDILTVYKFDEEPVPQGNRVRKVSAVMEEIQEIAESNGGKIKRADISDRDYKILNSWSKALGIYMKDLFATYEIDYVDGINKPRLSKVQYDGIPMIDELREQRDKLFDEFIIKNSTIPPELQFEKYIEICQAVYNKNKNKFMEYGRIESEPGEQ